MNKKSLFCFTSISILAFSMSACSGNTRVVVETGSFVKDKSFSTGLIVKGSKYSKKYDPALNVHFDYEKTILDDCPWQISQWNRADDYDLTIHNTFTPKDDHIFKYENAARTLEMDTQKNSLSMRVDTSLEYIADYGEPKLGEPGSWSHCLLSQNFGKSLYLSDYDKVFVKYDFNLYKCEFKGLNNVDMSSADGAAQIFMYFRVTGVDNNGSPRYIWVGMPLFDSRYKIINKYISLDSSHVGSTDDLIYSISNEVYMKGLWWSGVRKNYTYHLNLDITSLITEAYEYAKTLDESSKASFKNVPYDTLSILYFNYGFEMPGAFEMSANISNFDIYYENYQK